MLPPLAPVYGTQVLFYALAAFSLVTLLMLPFLDDYPVDRVAGKSAPTAAAVVDKIRWGPLAATLVAVFLFQAGNMTLAAYIIGLGRDAGLETGFISNAIGWATWIGIAGCLLVVVVGVRFGRWKLM